MRVFGTPVENAMVIVKDVSESNAPPGGVEVAQPMSG
jgi:hypothetical protein